MKQATAAMPHPAEYMDALDGGHWDYGDDSLPTVGVTYFAGTFVRHPLALAAAKATLKHLQDAGPELQLRLTARTTNMVARVNAAMEELGAPFKLVTFASWWRNVLAGDLPYGDLIYVMLRVRGIHILDNFPCFLTTAHTAEDIERVVNAFRESVRELQEADFVPRRKAPIAVVFDASKPPVPGARLGKEPDGTPAWFVRNPDQPDKYMKVKA